MVIKKIKTSEMTELEKTIMRQLQYAYDFYQNSRENEYANAEYNGMRILANVLVAPRKWACVNGVITLIEEVKE